MLISIEVHTKIYCIGNTQIFSEIFLSSLITCSFALYTDDSYTYFDCIFVFVHISAPGHCQSRLAVMNCIG